MFPQGILPGILLLLGVGFLIVNLRTLLDFGRFLRLRSSALLIWPSRKPPLYNIFLVLGVSFGLLVLFKLGVQRRPLTDAFGEGMMCLYYSWAFRLNLRIGRGFYEKGIWAERGFVPYSRIGGLSWREGKEITLILIYRMRNRVRHLIVPDVHYGESRRLLRDKIAAHDIHFTGKDFDLGKLDERDVV